MKAKVNCPAALCGAENACEDELYEPDDSGTPYRNLIECKRCAEPFVVEFHLTVRTVVRAVR